MIKPSRGGKEEEGIGRPSRIDNSGFGEKRPTPNAPLQS